MEATTETNISEQLNSAVKAIVASIPQEREQEIITRRFGLDDRKETLEQIGELLGITRERVRQLEKSILNKLRSAAEAGELSELASIERLVIQDLSENGRVARVQDIQARLTGADNIHLNRSRIAFIGELSAKLVLLNENDNYYQSVAIIDYFKDTKSIKTKVDEVFKAIKAHGQPLTMPELHDQLPSYEQPAHIQGLASVSKKLTHLKDIWGLTKWPTVNPKNIRDKIFVILTENGKPMHFSEIAKSIKDSSFKRRDVTTQAIHNELIKDSRFVLIGRGIYALEAWGYARGTVSQIIAKVLSDAGEPLHRDEIVKRVLKSRQVKETTVLLNLQSKPEFKRVAKATYTLAETPAEAEASPVEAA